MWYRMFVGTLESLGFTVNPYDKCTANKMIDGKQCTVTWYVDDIKISHVDKSVVTSIIDKLQNEYISTYTYTFKEIDEHIKRYRQNLERQTKFEQKKMKIPQKKSFFHP